jgi:hypothetical protein
VESSSSGSFAERRKNGSGGFDSSSVKSYYATDAVYRSTFANVAT